MTLKTGQQSLKTDVGPPKVIVCRPSHPFSFRTQLFLHEWDDSCLRGTCTLWRSRWWGTTKSCGKFRVGHLGSDEEQLMNNQYLSTVKTMKINDYSFFSYPLTYMNRSTIVLLFALALWFYKLVIKDATAYLNVFISITNYLKQGWFTIPCKCSPRPFFSFTFCHCTITNFNII